MSETITNKQMLDTLMQAISEVKKEVNNKIEDAKKEIKQENQKLLYAIEHQSEKICKIEDEFLKIEDRCRKIEREIRKNNVLIFGLEIPENECLINYTLSKIAQLTGVEIHETDINNIYKLKTEGIAPIKVEFNRYLKKDVLIQNCYKLKGTKLTIVHDLCPEDQADQKILRRHLNEARSKHYLAKIKRNTLIVNNEVYTIQDLRRTETEEHMHNITTKKRSESEPTITRENIISNITENNYFEEDTSSKELKETQENAQPEKNQEERKKTEKRPNTSPADPKREEQTKIIRTNSTSSTKSDKGDRPRRTPKSVI